jgi:hypothetical protein
MTQRAVTRPDWHMRTPYAVALGFVTIALTAMAVPLTDRWWIIPLLMPVILVVGYIRLKLWPLFLGRFFSLGEPPDC